MWPNENTSKQVRDTLREMISSIRELNRRIDELKYVIRSGWCTCDSKRKIVERIAELINSRFSLIYSIYDIRRSVIESCPLNSIEHKRMEEILSIDTLYKELKNI